MMTYEIEIKSLLGEEENADELRKLIIGSGAIKKSKNNQLNHYFNNGNFKQLLQKMKLHFSEEKLDLLENIIKKGESHSVRTREVDGIVKLVLKASVDDTTSENGIARMEFEEDVEMDLEDLDNILISIGFEYQAKWSRVREEYLLDDITICLDKNAGYGWISEFEIVVKEGSDRHNAEMKIRKLMDDLNVVELAQDRLARMFNYYNNNWQDYYGTNNIFNIE